jgi:uncharacterized phage-associated protein
MANALPLAQWLIGRHPDPITHLKLQKLAFYSYGAALAFGQQAEIGSIEFEAWDHGPVNRQIWAHYRSFGREPLPKPQILPFYGAELAQTLDDVLAVYGAMSAMALRNESHQEAPWKEAYRHGRADTVIDQAALKAHFIDKLQPGAVKIPGELLRSWSFEVDRIPLQGFASLHDLAEKLRVA